MDIIYTDLVLFPLKWGKGSLHPTYIKKRQVHPNYNVLCIISVISGETPNNLLSHRKIARSPFLSYS